MSTFDGAYTNNDPKAVFEPILRRHVEEVSAEITYIGFAPVGTLDSENAWLISKITASGVLSTVDYASITFDNIWDDRAGLSFS